MSGEDHTRLSSLPAAPRRAPGGELALGGALTLLAIGLHVFCLWHAGGLWRDEVNSLQTANAPSLRALPEQLVHDSAPVVFFVVLRAWCRLGGSGSDLLLRAAGVGVGLLTLSMLWICARGLGRSAPVAALALAGLNPEFIRWGDSLRPFGLGVALILAAYAAFWRLAKTPTVSAALMALACGVLSVHCAYQNVVLLAAIVAGAVAVAIRRRKWRAAVAAAAVGVLAEVSLLPMLPMVMVRVAGWNRIIQGDFSAVTLGGMLVAASRGALPGPAWAAVLLAGLAVAPLAWSQLGGGSPEPAAGALFGAVTASFALAGTWVLMSWLQYGVRPWYCLGLIAVAALGLDAARPLAPRAGTAVLVTFLALALALVPAATASLAARNTNADLVGSALRRATRPGDVIVVSPWYMALSLRRYYGGPAVVETIPPLGAQGVHRYDLVWLATLAPDPLRPLRETLVAAIESGHRIFVVQAGPPPVVTMPPPSPLVAPAGWSEVDHTRLWTLQMTHFLGTRSTRVGRWRKPGVGHLSFTGYEVLGYEVRQAVGGSAERARLAAARD